MGTNFRHGGLRGLRVVVAAEDPYLRDLLKLMVTMCASHSLAVGTSGAADFKPDVLLVALPLHDFGHGLLRHAARARTPVVAVDVDRVQQQCGELFMSGFTLTAVKRFDMDDIMDDMADGVLTAIARRVA